MDRIVCKWCSSPVPVGVFSLHECQEKLDAQLAKAESNSIQALQARIKSLTAERDALKAEAEGLRGENSAWKKVTNFQTPDEFAAWAASVASEVGALLRQIEGVYP